MSLFSIFGAALLVLAIVLQPTEAEEERRRFTVGSDATLQCSWSGIEDQNLITLVRWFRRGQRLRSKKYTFERSGQNYTLTIKDIQKKDKGAYTCSPKLDIDMSLADGRFNVEVVDAVLPEAPEITNFVITEGGMGSLNCNYKVAKENNDLELFWTRDESQLKAASGSLGVEVGSDTEAMYETYTDENGLDWIRITDVDLGAGGVYSCNYQYKDGRVFSMSFNVTVKEVEDPSDIIRNITMKEDFEFGSLLCNVTTLANRIKRFYWEKDGVELMNGDKYTISETSDNFHTLTVQTLDADLDQGVYRCVAELKEMNLAVRFNVSVIKSTKNTDFTKWTDFSVCDKQNKKYRFRTCSEVGCLQKYAYVYEVDSEPCENA